MVIAMSTHACSDALFEIRRTNACASSNQKAIGLSVKFVIDFALLCIYTYVVKVFFADIRVGWKLLHSNIFRLCMGLSATAVFCQILESFDSCFSKSYSVDACAYSDRDP